MEILIQRAFVVVVATRLSSTLLFPALAVVVGAVLADVGVEDNVVAILVLFFSFHCLSINVGVKSSR